VYVFDIQFRYRCSQRRLQLSFIKRLLVSMVHLLDLVSFLALWEFGPEPVSEAAPIHVCFESLSITCPAARAEIIFSAT
jgi:hypothetical protein